MKRKKAEEEKKKREEEKKIKEAAKNAVRKEKKAIKRMLRDNNNFLPDDANPEDVVSQLAKLDQLLDNSDVVRLEEIRVKLEQALPFGREALLLVFDEEHLLVMDQVGAEKTQATSAKVVKTEPKHVEWTTKETSILIKAVKLFPGGTVGRWEKIAEYVQDHGESNEKRSPKDCIVESKKLQSAQASQRASLQQTVIKPSKVEIVEKPSE